MDENDNKKELETNKEEVKQEEPKLETTSKTPEKDRKGLAIAAMVLGIVALVLFCIWYISIPCAILSIVFGILSLKSSKRGMAIAGIATGAVGFVLMVILYVFVFFVVGVGTYTGLQNFLENYDDYNYDYHYNLYDSSYDSNDWF